MKSVSLIVVLNLSICALITDAKSWTWDFKIVGVQQNYRLTNAEKTELIRLHNLGRSFAARGLMTNSGRQPKASNMVEVIWDKGLEERAQNWADQCTGGHNQAYMKNDGQNVAFQAKNNLIRGSILGWYDKEEPFFTYNGFDGREGHFTQMIDARSIKVGCGAKYCRRAKNVRGNNGPGAFLVCNFSPKGNIRYQAHGKFQLRPYREGTPCSQCPEGYSLCHKDICVRKCPSGKRCTPSTIKKNNQNQQQPSCRDFISNCKQNMDNSPNICSYNKGMQKRCPKSCKICGTGNGNGNSRRTSSNTNSNNQNQQQSSCYDFISNCKQNMDNSPNICSYSVEMQKRCPKSCKICGTGNGNSRRN